MIKEVVEKIHLKANDTDVFYGSFHTPKIYQ